MNPLHESRPTSAVALMRAALLALLVLPAAACFSGGGGGGGSPPTPPPVVFSSDDADRSVFGAIDFTCSAAPDPATLDGTTVRLTDAGGNAVGILLSVSGRTILLTPTSVLRYATLYIVRIDGLRLVDGTVVDGASWNFTTRTDPGTGGRFEVVATDPVQGSTVAPPAELSVRFSEALAPAALEPRFFTVTGPGNVDYPTTAHRLDPADATRVLFETSVPLPADSLLTLSARSGVPAASGAILLESESVFFYTNAGGNSPSVVSHVPAAGAVVDPPTSITVEFDARIDPASVNAANFLVVDSGGVQVAGGRYTTFGDRTAVFLASEPLSGPNYEVLLTAGMRASDGTSIVPYSFTFEVRSTSGSWSVPEVIPGYSGRSIGGVGMDANDSGVIAACWLEQSLGPEDDVRAAVRFVDGTWSTAQTLDTSSLDTEAPQVAVGDDGTIVVSWQKATAQYTTNEVVACVWDGSAWGPETVLGVLPRHSNSAGRTFVHVDDTGLATVVWDDDMAVRQRTYRNGSWEPETVLADGPPAGGSNLRQFAGRDLAGNMMLATIRLRAEETVASHYFVNGAGWQPEVVHFRHVQRSNRTSLIHAVLTPGGAGFVAFSAPDGNGGADVRSAAFAGGAWNGARPIPGQVVSFAPFQLHVDDQGNAVFVEARRDNGRERASAQIYDFASDTWSQPTWIADDQVRRDECFLLTGRAGRFAVTWNRDTSAGDQRLLVVHDGTAWGAPQPLPAGMRPCAYFGGWPFNQRYANGNALVVGDVFGQEVRRYVDGAGWLAPTELREDRPLVLHPTGRGTLLGLGVRFDPTTSAPQIFLRIFR